MSHGEKLEALCAVLGDEARACGALSGILREEQAAAIHLDPDAIVASLAGRRLLHERLVELAVARRGLVCSIAREQGENAERVTELLPLLAPEPARRVRDGLRGLRRAVLEARGLGRQNALFAEASLAGIGQLLHILGGLLPGARYGADARVAASGGPTNRIDRRV